MSPERILVPVELDRCSPEVFDLVSRRARRVKTEVILLHVLRLNIACPDNRLYDELEEEAEWRLEQLARIYLPSTASCLTRVRTGKALDEIVLMAKAEKADWIVLQPDPPSLWTRLKARWGAAEVPVSCRLAERLFPRVSCGIVVVKAAEWLPFDRLCERVSRANPGRPQYAHS